jgi:hypothetical protein
MAPSALISRSLALSALFKVLNSFTSASPVDGGKDKSFSGFAQSKSEIFIFFWSDMHPQPRG